MGHLSAITQGRGGSHAKSTRPSGLVSSVELAGLLNLHSQIC